MVPPAFPTTTETASFVALAIGLAGMSLAERHGSVRGRRAASAVLGLGLCLLLWALFVRFGVGRETNVMR